MTSADDDLVTMVHAKTPAKSTVKSYFISKIDTGRGGTIAQSSKGKESRIQQFEAAVKRSSVGLFKYIDGNTWQRLNVDYEKRDPLMKKLGGEKIFGGWETWGDVFACRDEQEQWPAEGAFVDMYTMLDDDHGTTSARPARRARVKSGGDCQTEVVVLEVVDLAELTKRASLRGSRVGCPRLQRTSSECRRRGLPSMSNSTASM